MIQENLNRPENFRDLGVFEESARLRKVMMWGAPGTEAVLGQLLPTEKSLFYSHFDVPKARSEFKRATKILESEGVEIVFVKDLLAKMLEEQGASLESDINEVREKIIERGQGFYEQYRDALQVDDLEEVLGWVGEVLEEDVQKYGERAAAAINKILSLDEDLPMANVVYARDQSNLLGNSWVWSSMKRKIRQPEVALYKKVLDWAGIMTNQSLEVIEVKRDDASFEGGDGIVNNGIAYIGVGGRTSVEGVFELASSLIGQGLKVMVPFDKERDSGLVSEMDAMHLDTIWMPVEVNSAVACIEEVKKRELFEVVKNKEGLVMKKRGNFLEHLKSRGVDIIPITKEEQKQFAPNFLNLGNKSVVLSLDGGNKLTKELERRGERVYNADLNNITKGYGGLHCMTASLKRD